MKVCQVRPTFLPLRRGGPEYHILNLSKALSRQGVNVEIFTGSYGIKPTIDLIAENVSVRRLPMLSVPLTKRSSGGDVIYRIIPSLPFILMRSKLDIVHAHDYYALSSDMATWISKISKKPLVLTIHSLPGFFSSTKVLTLLEKVYNLSMGRATLKQPAKIIFMSRFSIEQFLKLGIERDKAVVIHPSIDAEGLRKVYDKLNHDRDNFYFEKFGLKGDRIVLCVGRLEKRKGFQHVIKAIPFIIREAPSIKVVITGSDEGYGGQLVEMAKDLGVDRHVLFTGPLPDSELHKAMFWADVFTVPSELDNFPEVALKAMCFAKPVVASRVGGIPELIESGRNGILTNVGDVKELANAIITLLTNTELAKHLGTNAQKKVFCEYDLEAMARRTLSVYKEVLEEGM